jgi:hypothetical protein
MKNNKRTDNDSFRQGDVWIERVTRIPETAKLVQPKDDLIILAHGEVTGHHHSVDAGAADWWKTDTEEQYLDVKPGGASVKHQEHGPITLRPGKYRVIRQREYSPEAIRTVAD